tara:strand:- start:416 stop:991 length:576 start_codon:yes stop_codon:yes gene_type:complete
MTAKIKLNAASGGGSFSLQAPSSSANTRVMTLPDTADGTILTTTNPKAGNIIQVVSATSGGQATIASTGTFASTGLEATITPTSSSNKILIQVNSPMTGFAGGSGSQAGSLKVFRGGASGSSVESSTNGLSLQHGDPNNYSDAKILFLDSPSTTSATTYTVMMQRVSGDTTYSFNRNAQQTASIVLSEVAA